MDFDFHRLYKDYSNIELLKIVKRPEGYQPAAVIVATQILNERQVTDDEIQFVDQYFCHLNNAAEVQKERMDALRRKVMWSKKVLFLVLSSII
jgi:hypothetical protein